jgi:hypothetical protein
MTNQQEKEVQLTVPYIVHEAAQARAERQIKRQSVAIIIIAVTAIIAIFLTAFFIDKGWRDYFSECDIMNYDYSQDGEGVNIVGDSNGVDYSNGAKS